MIGIENDVTDDMLSDSCSGLVAVLDTGVAL